MFRRLQLFSIFVCLMSLFMVPACRSDTQTDASDPTAPPESNPESSATVAPPLISTETAVVDLEPVCILAQATDLRAGPGTSFNPPLRGLAAAETLTPLAFSAQGFPDGQWLEVNVAATGELGWVPAGSAFVTCTVSPDALPPATNIPPTPTIEPTETPEVVAQAGPPRITNNAPGGTKAEYVKDEVIVGDEFLFRMWIVDTRFGEQDGAGINHVDFTITMLDGGEIVYQNREDQAAFCIFQGGLPDCNPWPEENGRFLWPNGLEVVPGSYHATILVYPTHPAFTDEVWNWDFDFWIEQ